MISLRLREPNASRSILQAWSVSGGLQGEQPLRQPQCTHGLKQSMFNIVCMNDDVILVLAASRLAHTERIHHRTEGSWAIRGWNKSQPGFPVATFPETAAGDCWVLLSNQPLSRARMRMNEEGARRTPGPLLAVASPHQRIRAAAFVSPPAIPGSCSGSSSSTTSTHPGSCCFSIRAAAAAREWWEDSMHGGW